MTGDGSGSGNGSGSGKTGERALFAWLRLAFSTLTALPVGPPPLVDRTVAGGAMACAPLVGLVLGALAGAGAAALGWWTGSAGVAAVGGVALLAALTRGMHLDGLADTADGLGSARPPAEALRIMKASDIGPFGVVTLVLALLGQVLLLATAWGRYGAWYGVAALAIAGAAGRLAVAWACRPGVPSARPEGLGAWVAESVSVTALATASSATLLAAALAGLGVADGLRWLLWPAALVAGVAAALLLLRHAIRRFGGITGDVLGALVETGFTAALLVLAR